ncbi:hypothetical protein [Streptomyces sp. NBC_01262]|uniref:hypothetical protein n=1 Tax=Streptomyces sp. NBC_01262 TaxID=2903803 RepID=UPI002E33A33E|nr:hypothetical protein [Streptomyces sp. NBC_01262]
MRAFGDAALGYPTALFSFALLVVIGYWGTVLLGGLDVDALHGGHGGHGGEGVDAGTSAHDGGFAGFLSGLGLGGIPATVTLSLLIAVAWFVSLVGAVLTDGALLGTAVLICALLSAWAATGLVLRPLRRLIPRERPPSRTDFVGRVCVIRTGRVGPDFGQAEVTADDGSTAVVQVRATYRDEQLTSGSSALIFDYDADGEFFRVTPYDAALDPHRPAG